MSDLTALTQARGRVKAKLTTFINFLEKIKKAEDSRRPELVSRLEKVEPLWDDFDRLQTHIEEIDESTKQAEERVTFEDLYHAAITDARALLSARDAVASSIPAVVQANLPIVQQPVPSNDQSVLQNTVRLPHINLPKFDGNYQQWISFRDIFISLIDNNTALSSVQKLHYLKSCLTGEASNIVGPLESSDTNYAIAWDLLKQRYENKKLLVQHHIQMLLDLPPVIKESHTALRQLADSIVQNTQILEKLGQPVEEWSTLLIHILVPKLDRASRREWELKRSIKDEFPEKKEFINFITQRSTFLEQLAHSNSTNQSPSSIVAAANPRLNNRNNKNISHAYVSSEGAICPLCQGNHKLVECTSFRSLSVTARIAVIKEKRLCIKCFKNYHGRNCNAFSCKKCKGYHHTMLHIERVSEASNNNSSVMTSGDNQISKRANGGQQSTTSNNDTNSPSTSFNHCATLGSCQVLLSTAIILIYDQSGKPHECRALLDNGSQSNFLTQELTERLQLRRQNVKTTIRGINDVHLNATQQVYAKIQSRCNAFTVKLPFLTINKITENLPLIKIPNNSFNIPPNITLADPTYNIPNKIDVLLGASIFWDLLCVGQIRLSKCQPTFQKTQLGWVISGAMQTPLSTQLLATTHCCLTSTLNLQDQMERFWKIEEINDIPHFSKEEKECEEHFMNTHTRERDGRFVVKLPFKSNNTELGDSRQIAERRLFSLERKLQKQPGLQEQYKNFLHEYEQLGHMTVLPKEDEIRTNCYYIPHHAVVKESSSTTKVRVVFDASCSTSSGKSLNDLLMVGPTIQDELFSIIMRLRQHKYAISADIIKMYRQVRLHPEHRPFQRIVWRDNIDSEIHSFQLNTVTYGMASSPFVAIRCLHQLAKEHRLVYPEASEAILHDFYVDDLLTGGNDLARLKLLKQDVTKILAAGQFYLQKWRSNVPELRADSDTESSPVRLGDIAKTLGLLWNTTDDTLQYRTHTEANSKKMTKRTILSVIAQIYDPLGLLGPLTVKAKILLQRLWQLKIGWDESLPIETYTTWCRWYRQIHHINDIVIPRFIMCPDPKRIELHAFCDASEAAYGACVYIRSCTSLNEYSVRLLCAKSRVSPLKTISLPRLELCGAVLLSQLCNKVITSLTCSINDIHYWSDSTIVLTWIFGEPHQWNTFVSNRVAEIHRNTHKASWHHIKSENNPADVLSRGVYPEELQGKELWWKGPEFLYRHINIQPFDVKIIDGEIPEVRKTAITMSISTCSSQGVEITERFSSLSKLLRVIAYCMRFKIRASNVGILKTRELTVEELEQSLIIVIKVVQRKEFAAELQGLKSNSRLPNNSKLTTLYPFIDNHGLIRVGGRLRNAPIPFSQKHPIVLPSKSHLTDLIIRDEHYRNLHGGQQAILAAVRTKYWPLSGRHAVRRVLRKCIVCFRSRPISTHQLMGNLPATRVTQARPFLNTGLDYAGPFTIKISRNKSDKAYLCIFVCFATKAVHMELVSSLTTVSFLNALKGFISRRGKCINLYSDNGTNFVGANNLLKELKTFLLNETTQQEIRSYLLDQFINWHFIPPRSPHIGGLWEAAVKSAKTHMRRIIGLTPLYFEELYTLIVQIEGCLNSRPLLPLSSDCTDLSALTPGHFLIGEPITCIPERDVSAVPINRLNRYQMLIQMKQHFWSRWSREYISQLQQRVKWKHNCPSRFGPGTMILVKDENTPPMTWPLGRIIKCHPDKDGLTRIVTIRTKKGECQTALAKICILPIEDHVVH